ncbi:MAG: hypothetical protein IPO14_00770 [Saprospiraceae bacterium]|jgi:hypothetical protein|nr:hypothetical protein [Saprospiraceae bacterium]
MEIEFKNKPSFLDNFFIGLGLNDSPDVLADITKMTSDTLVMENNRSRLTFFYKLFLILSLILIIPLIYIGLVQYELISGEAVNIGVPAAGATYLYVLLNHLNTKQKLISKIIIERSTIILYNLDNKKIGKFDENNIKSVEYIKEDESSTFTLLLQSINEQTKLSLKFITEEQNKVIQNFVTLLFEMNPNIEEL